MTPIKWIILLTAVVFDPRMRVRSLLLWLTDLPWKEYCRTNQQVVSPPMVAITAVNFPRRPNADTSITSYFFVSTFSKLRKFVKLAVSIIFSNRSKNPQFRLGFEDQGGLAYIERFSSDTDVRYCDGKLVCSKWPVFCSKRFLSFSSPQWRYVNFVFITTFDWTWTTV